mmetsp:Transcript_20515/g.68656  ORF Transcript_20515/g.68656 Transcript_20515/m.68656 type:complete len:139 (-) Transcript_20515:366-782(-)
MFFSSSSSSTSIKLCSSVFPTMTCKIGSTSKSKSNSSPSKIWVSRSIPVFLGMNSGVGGLEKPQSIDGDGSGRGPVHERIRLCVCIDFRRSISYLLQEHLRLHVHVLPSRYRIRSSGSCCLPAQGIRVMVVEGAGSGE